MSLENKALHWLAYEKKCNFVTMERSPRHLIGQPDVLGVSMGRKLIEIEIKRSMSDFRCNAKKHHIRNRDHYISKSPSQIYFLVPEKLTEKARLELPPWAGLMDDSEYKLKVIIKAPVNKQSEKLTPIECARLMRNLSNHICSLHNSIDQWRNSQETDWGIEYRI